MVQCQLEAVVEFTQEAFSTTGPMLTSGRLGKFTQEASSTNGSILT